MRALKSAIFGAPALVDEDTVLAVDKGRTTMAGKDKPLLDAKNASPTKRGGILITPGTATGRRKTVSFGNGIADNERSKRTASDAANAENPFGSSGPKTSLTKALEASREKKPRQTSSTKAPNDYERKPSGRSSVDSNRHTKLEKPNRGKMLHPEPSDQELMQDLLQDDDDFGDVTVDINEPHSQSGKYWKTEFENYHEEAKSEMRKLVRYKKLAKSYAKKKDEEALAMGERLKEEQQKVVRMEDNISKLSTQIEAQSSSTGSDEGPEMMQELARQTALATRYKAEVEQFRATLEDRQAQEGKTGSTRTQHTASAEQDNRQKEKEGTKQAEEIASLRAELRAVKRTLSNTERESEKLRHLTEKLTQELRQANERHDRHLEKCEQRKQGADEERQSLQKRFNELKELTNLQRLDAEHLLKKRHDQVTELKNEIAKLKPMSSVRQENQDDLHRKSVRNLKTATEYAEDLAKLKRLGLGDLAKDYGSQQLDPLNKSTSSDVNYTARGSQIPIASQARAPKLPSGSLVTHAPRSILSEITNSASKDTPLAWNERQKNDHVPMKRHSDANLQYAEAPLPYPTVGRTILERKHLSSPQYSINVNSSPSKLETGRSRIFEDVSPSKPARGQQENIGPRPSSLTLGGSRKRSPLPPDRLAAAKARLEQRMANKKKNSGLA